MSRRLAALVVAGAAVLALCAGCGGGTRTGTGGPAGDPAARLDQLQSILDSVSAQVNADSAP